jgi:hypothetical protein
MLIDLYELSQCFVHGGIYAFYDLIPRCFLLEYIYNARLYVRIYRGLFIISKQRLTRKRGK